MTEFEWDSNKAKSNLKRHGISFEEAQSVFYDDYALQFYDESHSEEEDRFLLLGLSNTSRLLMIGVFQASCPKNYAALISRCVQNFAEFSGLSQTSSIRFQFRVLPLQRNGCLRFASWYNSSRFSNTFPSS